MKYFIYFIFFIFLIGCQPETNESKTANNIKETPSNNHIKYAKGFTIEEYENYKILTLKNAWVGDKSSFKYVLYSNEKPRGIKDAIFIKTPVKSIACMSLTHVAFIEKLSLEQSIVAISGCDYLSSPKIVSLYDNGTIREIGQNQQINYELLIEQNPDLVMGFGVDASSNSSINKMEELGLTVVLNAEYMETHPLGKAEWIKFIAAFYSKDELGTTIFNEIERAYLDLLILTQDIK